jgi:hypothetical protein
MHRAFQADMFDAQRAPSLVSYADACVDACRKKPHSLVPWRHTRANGHARNARNFFIAKGSGGKLFPRVQGFIAKGFFKGTQRLRPGAGLLKGGSKERAPRATWQRSMRKSPIALVAT